MAFVKRLLIGTMHSPSQISAGLIFLISEICKTMPALLEMLTNVEMLSERENGADSNLENDFHLFGNFDGNKRAPEYACVATPSMWEIPLLRSHFHPSVQVFVNSFCSAESDYQVTYDGDPIVDFSLSTFLNRFAYKTAKKKHISHSRRTASSQVSEDPVNSNQFLKSDYNDIAPDKAFFHRYFGNRAMLLKSGKSRIRTRRHTGDSDSEDSNSDSGSDGGSGSDRDVLDEEMDMDQFADKLANDLMEKEESDGGEDDDDDHLVDMDIDDSEGEEVDEFGENDDSNIILENDDLEFADFLKSKGKKIQNTTAKMEDDDEEEGEYEVSNTRGKKNTKASKRVRDDVSQKAAKKKSKLRDMSAFASSEDYEEQMESIVSNLSASKNADYNESVDKMGQGGKANRRGKQR